MRSASRTASEAQWEKAARGPSTGSGDGRKYPWGDQPPDPTLLNFNNNARGATVAGHYSP
ncbi:MAG: hypothetical protein M1434_14600 [Chloroflexi bacterium]|nr:hypothetical protein [Chloroflexota bacterium]